LFPGTVGSVVGIGIYLVLVRLNVLSEACSTGWPVVLAVVFVAGVLSARRCELIFGADNRRIVIDEIWGMMIAVFLLPVSWSWLLAAFLIFRLFDIIKPFPARRVESVSGGFGVMLDDGFAGLYTNLILQAYRGLMG
jgi:phosphatidylglycerophosphatase A